MIQPLRNIHRWIFTGFAFLLPALLVIAVAERHQYVQAGKVGVEFFSGTPVTSQRRQFQLIAFGDGIELNATSSTPWPEVLVYWSQQTEETLLPSDVRLLGTYHPGARYGLPQGSTGTVLLFSPANNLVIDSIFIERVR